MSNEFIQHLQKFNPKFNEPIAPFTTWKLGGPAEVLVEINDSEALSEVLVLAINNQVKYTILGGGSNVLVSDKGLPGLVIINRSKKIEILDSPSNLPTSEEEIQETADDFNPYITPRHSEVGNDGFYSFKDLDYEEKEEKVKVKLDSGVSLNYALACTLKNNLTGLQWFSGIPGTIGGALFNNIHGGTKHFSDYFASAKILSIGADSKPEIKEVDFAYFGFGYDQSILRQDNKIVVLEVTLNLFKGDVDKARYVAKEWTKRKRIQPRTTAGCNFKNIPAVEQERLGFPTPSVGYLVDKVFGWGGKELGGVKISSQHSNFIENLGNGTASQVYTLIQEIKTRAKQEFNLDLENEINFLGEFS